MHAKTTVLPAETQMQLHCGYLLTHHRKYLSFRKWRHLFLPVFSDIVLLICINSAVALIIYCLVGYEYFRLDFS